MQPRAGAPVFSVQFQKKLCRPEPVRRQDLLAGFGEHLVLKVSAAVFLVNRKNRDRMVGGSCRSLDLYGHVVPFFGRGGG
jgi:hypothetical protein